MLVGKPRSGSLSTKALKFDQFDSFTKPLDVLATANKYEAMLNKYKAAKQKENNDTNVSASNAGHFADRIEAGSS